MKREAIGTWRDVTLTDLFFAFRKAKADCFFERSICIAREFAGYERDLARKLIGLLDRLHVGEVPNLLAQNLGQKRVVAKKLGTAPKKHPEKGAISEGHGFSPTQPGPLSACALRMI